MIQSRIERLDLPAHESVVADMIERYKQLQRDGWDVTVLVRTLRPKGSRRFRRDVAVIGLACRPGTSPGPRGSAGARARR